MCAYRDISGISPGFILTFANLRGISWLGILHWVIYTFRNARSPRLKYPLLFSDIREKFFIIKID